MLGVKGFSGSFYSTSRGGVSRKPFTTHHSTRGAWASLNVYCFGRQSEGRLATTTGVPIVAHQKERGREIFASNAGHGATLVHCPSRRHPFNRNTRFCLSSIPCASGRRQSTVRRRRFGLIPFGRWPCRRAREGPLESSCGLEHDPSACVQGAWRLLLSSVPLTGIVSQIVRTIYVDFESCCLYYRTVANG